jgi:hypothetical protein
MEFSSSKIDLKYWIKWIDEQYWYSI